MATPNPRVSSSPKSAAALNPERRSRIGVFDLGCWMLGVGCSLLALGCFSSLQAEPPAPNADADVQEFRVVQGFHQDRSEWWNNVLVIFEVYALDRDEAASVLAATDSGAVRYREVRTLSRAGKARLALLTALTLESGERSTVEATDEVRYPTAFRPSAEANGVATPTAWESRHAGDGLMIESYIEPHQFRKCDFNIIPERVRFAGFRSSGMDPAISLAHPIFEIQKLTIGTSGRKDTPSLLGTFTPLRGGEAREVWLAFVHLELQGAPAARKTAAKPAAQMEVKLDYRWYSMERGVARDLLSPPGAIEGSWDRLPRLLKAKKARLEGEKSIRSKTVEPIARTENSTAASQRPLNWPGPNDESFAASGEAANSEPHPLGTAITATPMMTADGLGVVVRETVSEIQNAGFLQGAGVPAPAPAVFTTAKIDTVQTVRWGRYALVGTFNRPGADGVNDRTDSGRTWLLFVGATPAQP